MDMNGMNFTGTGALMNHEEMISMRKKKGQCISCGRQTHIKKMFKMIALTKEGEVLEGRCLRCKPLDNSSLSGASTASFYTSMSNLSGRNLHSGSSVVSAPPVYGTAPSGFDNSVGRAGPRLKAATSQMMNLNRVSATLSGKGQAMSPHDDGRSVCSQQSTDWHGSSANVNVVDANTSRRITSARVAGDNHSMRPQAHPLPINSPRYRTEYLPEEDPRRRRSAEGAEVCRQQSQSGVRRRVSVEATEYPSAKTLHEFVDDPKTRDGSGRSLSRTHSQESGNGIEEPGRHRAVDRAHNGSSFRDRDIPPSEYSPRQNSPHAHGTTRNEQLRKFLDRGGAITKDRTTNFKSGGSFCSPTESLRLANLVEGSLRSLHSSASQPLPPLEYYEFQQHHRTPPPSAKSRSIPTGTNEDRLSRPFTDVPIYSRDSRTSVLSAESAIGSYTSDRKMSALDSHCHFDRPSHTIQEKGVLTVEQALQVMLHTHKVIDIVDLMRELPSSNLVQLEGCKYFSSVDLRRYDCEIRHVFHHAGGCEVVTAAMKAFPRDGSIQEMACKVLELFSGDASSIEFKNTESSASDSSLSFVQYSAVELVTTALSNHPSNVNVQKHGVTALANWSTSELMRPDIVECQCVNLVVQAMTAHSLDAWLQEVSCLFLANVSSQDSSFKEVIAECGGVDAICIAMVMHPTIALLQQVGCRALRFLSASNDKNKTKIESAGGIDSVISAMQVHRGEINVQKEGLWALSNLAINKHNKVVIGESNGVDVIIRAMWAHPHDAELQELACRTLWTLSVNSQNKTLVAQLGGIKAIVNAMQGHSDNASVQEKGCGCLANLAANSDENKRLIVEGEGVDAVVMAMLLHAQDRVVQERAVNCVRKLAFEPHLEALRAAGVVALVEQAAQAFPAHCREKADQVLAML